MTPITAFVFWLMSLVGAPGVVVECPGASDQQCEAPAPPPPPSRRWVPAQRISNGF